MLARTHQPASARFVSSAAASNIARSLRNARVSAREAQLDLRSIAADEQVKRDLSRDLDAVMERLSCISDALSTRGRDG